MALLKSTHRIGDLSLAGLRVQAADILDVDISLARNSIATISLSLSDGRKVTAPLSMCDVESFASLIDHCAGW